LPFSSLYAPTPKLIFRGSLSALKASVTPTFGNFIMGFRAAVRVVNTENWIRGTGGNGRPARNGAKGVGKGGRGATGEGGYEHSSTINEWRK
jgi:hypothetical protein